MTTASLRPTLILLVCIANTIIHAQTITLGGTIRDSYSVSPVESIRVDISQASDPGKLYTVYTSAAGTWSYSFLSTGAGRTDVVPFAFDLQQNFPNPFNPSTTIPFSIKQNTFVSLKVFDIVGREVATILNGDMKAGNYTRQWNASGLSAGIYFYRLSAGKFIETKKLILLK